MKIIFCLPGNNFSGRFLECWTRLIDYCWQNGIQYAVSRHASSNVYYVRNICLGGDVRRGVAQKPFNGAIEYDYLMWIDSDQVFTPQQFQRLLDHDQDIVSGVYLMANGHHLTTVKEWDEEYFKEHGSFQFLTLADIQDKTELMPVSYTGFGFMLIKYGVFEALPYPWFQPITQKIGHMVDFASEDVSFCQQASGAGYQIYIDPMVKVGHEKLMIL